MLKRLQLRRYIHPWRSEVKRPLRRELASLTLPIFIETLLIMTLGACDTMMLSRHSDESVAAVGLANQVISFCFLVFEVINLGTSVLCSQYLGARLHERMERVVSLSLALNLIFGLGISLALGLFPRQILYALGLNGTMLDEGAGYMRIVGLFAFVQALAMTLSAALRSNNKAVYPMLVILVVNVLNILGNYMLIFGKFGAPAMGVEGAATATVAARCVAMLILFVIVFRTTVSRFHFEIFRRFPREEFRNLMKIGIPSAGESMSYSCSQLVIAYFITSLGMEALAARTYCVNIIMFTYLFCIAIAHGGAISIGHLVGAGKWNGAYLMGKYVMRIGTIITFSIAVICALSGHAIFSWLTDNPEIIYLGTTILWIDVVLEIGRPINIVYVNTLQSAGDVNYPFYVGLIFMWSIAVGMAYVVGIPLGFGILGMWWMFALDENVRGIVFLRRWNSKGWMNKGFVTTKIPDVV
ncbi:MAG: MATE family efflux transporter [Muribaculaceae bacterium]|nr:MATE family efflux transporter [Muribaculaceae bacterium]